MLSPRERKNFLHQLSLAFVLIGLVVVVAFFSYKVILEFPITALVFLAILFGPYLLESLKAKAQAKFNKILKSKKDQ